MDELAGQIAYENIYPGMDARMEFMLAQLTAIYVQANTKKGKSVKLSDFMLSELMEKDKGPAKSDNIENQIRATFSLFPKSN